MHMIDELAYRLRLNRRLVLKAASIGLVLEPGDLFAQQLDPTPVCGPNQAATIRQTEGPFFKPRSPRRSDLIEPGMSGQPIEIAGHVLTRGCNPVPNALIEVWQADASGAYDNAGFRLRGHLFTDGEGRFRLRTIVPGGYIGRTRHIHVKVQPPGGRILTTQIYFPGEPANSRDPLFRKELLLRTAKAGGVLTGRFDFVLDMG
ncbi:MAG TPA: intradiol ring-cleavage dioxygenase [Xanthobacteraceae bacterium]|nr:intradiol ring-cleavage dioxygenase [Xanthobacteraceae bacterium]